MASREDITDTTIDLSGLTDTTIDLSSLPEPELPFDPPTRGPSRLALVSPPTVRVADQLVKVLYEYGVRVVFGVPGGAISPVFDALLDEPRIQVVTTHHESSAVYAAAAHARATGSVGVVLTTSGPGVTNALTGLASAFCDGLPVVVLSGEVPRKNFGRGALQEGSPYHLNVVAMVRHITKLALEMTTGEAGVSTLRKALNTAASGRKGPVFLSLPLDVQGASTMVPRMAVNVESRFEVDRSSLHSAVARLLGADRPMILAGSGVRWGDGPRELLRLAEAFSVPVATTPKAKGVFPESHPLSLGIFGHGGHPSASNYLDHGVDVLLAVGTSFGDAATNSWTNSFRGQRSFIQIDIDGTQIGKNYPADLGLVGPAAKILGAISDLAPPRPPVVRRAGRTFFGSPDVVTSGKIKPQRAIWELQQILPRSTAYTCDIGEHMMFALHYLNINQPDGFYLASGLAAMGSSLGSATGVKLADRDRTVVAICGDGTLSMSAMDISTAAQAKLNIIYLVLNDGRYGMVEEGHRSIYGRTPAFPVELKLRQLAEGLGAQSILIEQAGQILDAASAILHAQGPIMLDVRIDPEERMPRRARFDSIRNFVSHHTNA